MQWDASPTAGFCPPGVTPWLPVNDDRATANVADQSAEPDSMLSLYRDLLRLRREHPALHRGRLDLVPGAPAGTLAWLRSDGDDRVLVAANFGDATAAVPLGEHGELLVATDASVRVDDSVGIVRLPAHSAAVVRLAGRTVVRLVGPSGRTTESPQADRAGPDRSEPDPDVRIERLGPDDPTDDAVLAMVDGFLSDPLYAWLHPLEVRFERLGATFRLMLDAGRANGRVEVARAADGHVVGVAIWTAAGEELLDPDRADPFAALFRSQLGERADVAFESMVACSALEPDEPHAVLHSVVVRPDARNAGVGARLLGPLLEHCDREQVVASLDSSEEHNLTFYRRHGFREVGEVTVPDGPVMRALHRRPRST